MRWLGTPSRTEEPHLPLAGDEITACQLCPFKGGLCCTLRTEEQCKAFRATRLFELSSATTEAWVKCESSRWSDRLVKWQSSHRPIGSAPAATQLKSHLLFSACCAFNSTRIFRTVSRLTPPASARTHLATYTSPLLHFSLIPRFFVRHSPLSSLLPQPHRSLASHRLKSSSSELPYAVGDLILVDQGFKLHDAKVLELGDGSVDGEDVFVHYQGWPRSWDTWVRLECTRPITPESRAEQARMAEEFKQRHNTSKKKQRTREQAATGRPHGTHESA